VEDAAKAELQVIFAFGKSPSLLGVCKRRSLPVLEPAVSFPCELPHSHSKDRRFFKDLFISFWGRRLRVIPFAGKLKLLLKLLCVLQNKSRSRVLKINKQTNKKKMNKNLYLLVIY